MGAVQATVQIGVCVLISVAAVVSCLVVWRDDHKWADRQAAAHRERPDWLGMSL